jgi:hypothetical protein
MRNPLNQRDGDEWWRRPLRVGHLLPALASVCACGFGEVPDGPAITSRDSIGIQITRNDLTRLDAICTISTDPTVTIGAVEGDERYELYRVFGARKLSDGRIAVVNQGSQQLRLYDRDGQFLSQSGRAGEGPGEFRDAFYLAILPGDTIWVGDYRPWRFLVFDADGNWVRTTQADPPYINTALFSVLEDGRFIIASRPLPSGSGTQFEPVYLTVVIHGPDGSLIDTIGSYPNGRRGRLESDPSALTLYPLFESFARASATGTSIVIAHTSQPEYSILTISDTAQVERIVRWTPGDRTIPTSEIEAERRRIAEPYEDLDPGMQRRLVQPLVSTDRPIADQFPAFASLVAGRDGRIWVREYARPSAPEPHHWLVFGAGGSFQCRATIPAFDEILEFGNNYVLVEDTDDLGVERVLEYTLSQPSEVN